MKQILFAGSEPDAFEMVRGGPAIDFGQFDANYSRCAIRSSYDGSIVYRARFRSPDGAPDNVGVGDILYFHALIGANNTQPNLTSFVFYGDDGYGYFRVRLDASRFWVVDYNSGTGVSPIWTTLTLPLVQAYDGLYPFDAWFQFGAGNNHKVSLAVNGTFIGTATFNKEMAAIASVTLAGVAVNTGFSEVLATRNIPTIGARVSTTAPNGVGALADWSGSAADLADAGFANDTSINLATAAEQAFMYSHTAMKQPPNSKIAGIVLTTRVRNDGSAPTNFRPGLYVSGAAYYAAQNAPIYDAYSTSHFISHLNPATGSPWTKVDVDAAQRGGKAIA